MTRGRIASSSSLSFYMQEVKMKLRRILPIVAMLAGCSSPYTEYRVVSYETAVITSEVQDYTHDLRIANLGNDIYVEVPQDYDSEYLAAEYTGEVVYYWLEGYSEKVSNRGWEYLR